MNYRGINLPAGPGRFRFGLIVVVIALALGVAACAERESAQTDKMALQVYKNPNCGCCGEWVEHMRTAGFEATVIHQQNVNSIKQRFGIAPAYQSCHTAVAEGYVFEGHIPAHIIDRFLAEKPQGALGLAVPGMPVGSPGMEMGDRHDDYDVLLLKKDGGSEIYAHIGGNAQPQN